MLHRIARPESGCPKVFRALRVVGSLAGFLVLVSTSVVVADEWQGQEVRKDGVLHVQNPATPMEEPLEVKLEELWRLGGDTDDEEEFFGLISRITSDSKGNVYLLDGQLAEVKIYSPDGEYLTTIGREGEGPGEFRRPGDMFLLPDGKIGVMQTVPGKIVQLTLEGEPAGEFPLPTPEGGGFQVLRAGQVAGRNLALQRMIQVLDQAQGKADLVFTIDLVSAKGELLSTLEKKVSTLDFASSIVTEKTFDTFENRWAVGDDGRIYACPDRDDYVIKIWNSKGELERVVTRPYEHYKRTAEQKEDQERIWMAFMKRVPNPDLRISDFDKDIQTVHVRDDGSIWVLTARGTRDHKKGTLGTFDVLDPDGRFVREVILHGQGDPRQDAYFFHKDRVYVVTGFLDAAIAQHGGGESEEELEEDPKPMEVICYRVDAPVLARGR